MPSSGCKTCARSEEHTSELQSHDNLVCRLLLEKKSAFHEQRRLSSSPRQTRSPAPRPGVRRARCVERGAPGVDLPGLGLTAREFFFNVRAPAARAPDPLRALVAI